MLCIKNAIGRNSISQPSRKSNQSKTLLTLRPIDFGRWNLPPEMANTDIISHVLDLENKEIVYTVEFDAPANFQVVETQLQYLPEDIASLLVRDTSLQPVPCPPLIGNPPFAVSAEYPFNDSLRVSKTITLKCENNPRGFAKFTHRGLSGLDLLTQPLTYTGQFIEDFFVDFFINGNEGEEIELPVGFVCQTGIIICEDSLGRTMRIKSIAVNSDRIHYHLDINNKPSTIIVPRITDEVIPNDSAEAFNFALLPPELSDSLEALADVVKIDKPSNQKLTLVGDPQDKPLVKGKQECGFDPDITFDQVKSVFRFNYSFFSESILDMLQARLWALIELLAYLFWIILPLCRDEWQTVKDLVKRIFAFDPTLPAIGDNLCTIPQLDEFVNFSIDNFLSPTTCCNDDAKKELSAATTSEFVDFSVKSGLIGPFGALATGNTFKSMFKVWQTLIACILYWLVCLLRRIRTILVYILIWVAYFILFAITFGAEYVCNLIKGAVDSDFNRTDSSNRLDRATSPQLGKELENVGQTLSEVRDIIENQPLV